MPYNVYLLADLLQVRSPVFFGVLSGALTKVEATRGGGDLAALKDLLNLTTFDSDSGSEGGGGEENSGRHRDQRVCLVRACVAAFPSCRH